jgi:hypothetical protein
MIHFGEIDIGAAPQSVIVIGAGASLSKFNFRSLYDSGAYIITVNETGKTVPFANAWFTLDPWGLWGPQLPGKNFEGKLYAAVPDDFGTPSALPDHRQIPTADITYLRRLDYAPGISKDIKSIFTGNSGHGAFQLAYHLKPEKILLLGIDGGRGYYYPSRKLNRSLSHLPRMFNDSLAQLKEKNIKVINGSPKSTVTCFPRYTPEYALEIFTS